MARILLLHYGVAMYLLVDKWRVDDWRQWLVVAFLQPVDDVPEIWQETVVEIKHAIDING